MRNFFEKFLEKFFQRRKKEVVTTSHFVCPWCHNPLVEGEPVTLYALYRKTDIEKLPKNICVICEKKTFHQKEIEMTKIIGCASLKCWSNKEGVLIYGYLKKNQVIPVSTPPKENRIFSFN
ncbi:MAG TPA: hypothetical protein P5230_00215 [Candidatus Magasanikbacteria bacterium]|nr:hypothetical protein [Candidatus Magasanikbacteria bacterium]